MREPLARPRNAAREAARSAGALTYQGGPCRSGHSGERYTGNAVCVMCSGQRDQRRVAPAAARQLDLSLRGAEGAVWLNTYLAIYAPEEFARGGWRRRE